MANNSTSDAQKDGSPPCHPQACAIQSCLTRNNYNEARCQGAVFNLYMCCQDFYKQHGDEATTSSCPKPDLLRIKMQSMPGAKGDRKD